jgi:hypothetical protein
MLYVEIAVFNRPSISNHAIFSAATERPPARTPDIPSSTR